ncbi:bidirectional sugar transporter SWEET5 [Punica granatum]|uniref:Bidirectional sugar transporter SWEET5 n=2 Tax=Punica granatum TaxID=22663 RepID=A0A6P8ELI5_PUNGR|nr:bidirectional sugar transporter SWEET5 [Punica granatum]PKI56962.1 hypothetical protein CRG98_022636 [Punica granatum]
MVSTETVRTIVGIIGNVISFGLFLSPVPTMVKIYKNKSVQAFKPDPYVMTVLNCMMWVFYGMPFVHPDSTLVWTINGAGLIMELIYVSVFLIYSNWPIRRKILVVLLIEVIFMAAVVLVTMLALHTTKKRTLVVGILAIIFNIGMYASPLTVMKRVIKTRSVKYMPFYLSLANFANGLIWTVYALLKFDINLLLPNGLGALSGLVQLILYAIYYKSTKWDDEPEKPTANVQLSRTNNNNA